MCGLFQVIQRGIPIDREAFRRALASMHHRGPDQSGEYFVEAPLQEQGGQQAVFCGFGHQRLAIIDLTDRSRQPFVANGNVLVFNGEIYNYKEIAGSLTEQSVALTTSGDTEVLFRIVERDNPASLNRLNGMWAFSFYSRRKNSLTLSRDRYGKKPLFYYHTDNIFIASSTILAIQTYLGRRLQLREKHLLSFITYGDLFPPQDSQTHFDEIHQVLPAHYAEFDFASWQLAQKPYFSFAPDHQSSHQHADAHPNALAELLKDCVATRLVSDRPVGLMLSGGIDSTLILSALAAQGLTDQCRIFIGETGQSQDGEYATQCVNQLGIKAETIFLDYGNDAFERFLKIMRHLEKPVTFTGSAMAMPRMYEAIAELGIPVVLDGTGGDEVFGGYWDRQFPYAARQALTGFDWRWLVQNLSCDGSENKVRKYISRALLPAPLADFNKRLKKKWRLYRNPYLKISLGTILRSSSDDPLASLGLTFDEALCADVSPGGRLGEWLWHNDRNSMMSSVEGRSPLLDYRLKQYMYSGYQNKFVSCWNKHQLRTAMGAMVPLPTQWRQQKQGFRWNTLRFMQSNQERIMELIRASRSLVDIVDIARLLSDASKSPELLTSSLCRKILAVSALEQGFEQGA